MQRSNWSVAVDVLEERMIDEAEDHLARIKTRLTQDIDAKYRAGQRDHGGILPEKPGMLQQAYAEVLDLAVYLLTALEQQERGARITGRDSS